MEWMDIPVMTTRGPAEDPVIKIDKEEKHKCAWSKICNDVMYLELEF